MNGVPDYYALNMKQTSKGIWYCDGFTVFDETQNVCVTKADDLMTKVEEILKTHNKETE